MSSDGKKETESVDPAVLKANEDKSYKIKATAFLAGVTGVSILFGFGTTLAAAKKKDPHYFDQGLTGQIIEDRPNINNNNIHKARKAIALHESGASLALRALGFGTLYAVAGCSLVFYGVWKLMAVNDIKEFRQKIGNWLPSIPKNNPPQGRTEFSGINDLLRYIIQVDEETKLKKKKKEDE